MKIRLAVLFGSKSCEHDVSIISGLQAYHAANTAKYDVFPVYISREGNWYVGDALKNMDFYKKLDFSLVKQVIPSGQNGKLVLTFAEVKKGFFKKAEEKLTADVVLPVFHGMNGEDGTIQGMLELWGIPYTSCGVLGSSVGMDKIAMKQLFRGCGFPVVPDVSFDRSEWFNDRETVLNRIEKALAYPVFVKPANLGSSIGISRADDRAALENALEVAASYDRRILVEHGIAKLREVNCSAMGYAGEVLVSTTEMPSGWEAFLSFDDKYMHGSGTKGMEALARKIPAPISEEAEKSIKQLTEAVFRALDCKGVVRIDYLLDDEDGSIYVGEINTIPGSLAFYLWEPVGITFDMMIDKMVEYAMQAQADKRQSVFSYTSAILERGGSKK